MSIEKINVVLKAGKENQKRHKIEQKSLLCQADVQKYDEGENAVNARQIFKCLGETDPDVEVMTVITCLYYVPSIDLV